MDEDKNREQRLSKATTESEDWDSDFISSVDDLSSFESNSLKQLEDYDDIESDSDAGKSTVSPLLEGCFKKLSFWDDGNKTLKGKLTSESHDSLAVGTSNQRTPTWKEEEFGKELSSRLNGGAGSRNLGEDESDFECLAPISVRRWATSLIHMLLIPVMLVD
ncbi:uncharacterized protein LOC135121717 [Zophobas morio]|uniref:uncharacterized protein LOC135121717 n=1 Tax=Zophobas morio TaxID=2755281 RepID=UPI0030830018